MKKTKKELKKENTNEKIIPTRNYYLVLIVSVLVIALTLYVRAFYLNYKMNESSDSIFYDKSINQINSDDVDFTLAETNEAILYVSYSGSNKIYNMEKKLYKEFEDKKLIDMVLYWDIAKYKNNNKYLDVLREKFPNISFNINQAPMIIYIKDGQAVDVFDSKYDLINYKVVDELLNRYGIV